MPSRRSTLFLLVGLLGPAVAAGAAAFAPPACGAAPFNDVASNHPLCAWIAQLKADGITAGCGGGNYCPDAPLTRGQAAMLLERAMRGTGNWEPAEGVFAHTLIVKPVPGDESASGVRLLNTLGGIDDASIDNRYLVLLEPGEYDLNGVPLHLKSHVTIQGAGRSQVQIFTTTTTTGGFGAANGALRSVTFWVNGSTNSITGFNQTIGGGSIQDVSFQVSGPFQVTGLQADSSLEDVSVVASGTTAVTAIRLGDGFFSLTDVRAFATSANGTAWGIDLASTAGDVNCIRCNAEIGAAASQSMPIRVSSMGAGNTLLLRDSETYAGAGIGDNPLATGLYVLSGKVVVEDSRLEADPDASEPIGIECSDAAANTVIEVNHSRLIGVEATVRTAANGNCTVRIGGSQLKGGAVDDNGSGTIDCVALYGDGFTSPGINSCF
jgi:hypothetical protein